MVAVAVVEVRPYPFPLAWEKVRKCLAKGQNGWSYKRIVAELGRNMYSTFNIIELLDACVPDWRQSEAVRIRIPTLRKRLQSRRFDQRATAAVLAELGDPIVIKSLAE